MAKRKTVGIISVCIGILMLIYSAYDWMSARKIVDAGPVKIYNEQAFSFSWPPIIAVLLFAGGIAIVVSEKK
ncbi:MAG: hypothetical protein IPP32_08935 [Bacteroidetes bacterium]|nr:hypothetical protein [Bacteroidota bacterium]